MHVKLSMDSSWLRVHDTASRIWGRIMAFSVAAEAFVPSHITTFGAIHTTIGLAPVLIGLGLYLFTGTIRLGTLWGKLYWLTGFVGAITALFIFHHGGFGPGHAVSIAMIIDMIIWALASRVARTRTIEIITGSLSYFFLWFFTTTETLTRFPVAHPFAASPTAPALIPVRLVMLVIMVAGIVWQVRRERANKPA